MIVRIIVSIRFEKSINASLKKGMVFYAKIILAEVGSEIIECRYYVGCDFFIVWVIPTLMVVRAYLKMNTDDKKSAINDFKSRRFIFTIGFMVTGAFFAHLGAIFAVSIFKIIGTVVILLGGTFSALTAWKKSKTASMVILVLLSILIYINII